MNNCINGSEVYGAVAAQAGRAGFDSNSQTGSKSIHTHTYQMVMGGLFHRM